MEVPFLVPYPPPGMVDFTDTPGAANSTSVQVLEKLARLSLESVAAVAISESHRAG